MKPANIRGLISRPLVLAREYVIILLLELVLLVLLPIEAEGWCRVSSRAFSALRLRGSFAGAALGGF
jgi:hypothetical protein